MAQQPTPIYPYIPKQIPVPEQKVNTTTISVTMTEEHVLWPRNLK